MRLARPRWREGRTVMAQGANEEALARRGVPVVGAHMHLVLHGVAQLTQVLDKGVVVFPGALLDALVDRLDVAGVGVQGSARFAQRPPLAKLVDVLDQNLFGL